MVSIQMISNGLERDVKGSPHCYYISCDLFQEKKNTYFGTYLHLSCFWLFAFFNKGINIHTVP